MSNHHDDPVQITDGRALYQMICYAALAMIVLLLLARGGDEWALFPSLVGVLTVAARWKIGPLLFLMALAWLGVADFLERSPIELILALTDPEDLFEHPSGFRDAFLVGRAPGLDFLFAVFVVLYVASHYRFVSVTDSIFPVDRRQKTANEKARKKKKRRPFVEPIRSPLLTQPRESIFLAFYALLSGMLALLLWYWLDEKHPGNQFLVISELSFDVRLNRDGLWQLLVLLWNAALLLLLAIAALAFVGWHRMTNKEAHLILQDELWRQTRREQSRIHRWLAWGNRKRAWNRQP